MFLDTSGLFSLYDRRDAFHAEAVRHYRGAPRLLTHSYVLAEFIPLITARGLPRREALNYLDDLLAHPLVEMTWVDEPIHLAAMALLRRRADKSYFPLRCRQLPHHGRAWRE